jgi:uncharacterized protein YegL
MSEDTAAVLLPFYVLVDVSWSMTSDFGEGTTGIEAVNAIAPEVADLFDKNPVLRDKVRFGIVDFAGEAEVRIPLCDMGALGSIPKLNARTDGTSYANALKMMRSQIEADVAQLKADKYKVHRPAVFFLTDGEPTDSEAAWQAAFAELTEETFRARPNFVPFGVGAAKKAVLDRLARYKTATGDSPKSFLASDKVSASEAISSMIEMLLASILESGKDLDAHGADGGWVLPDPEEEDDPWL